MLPAVDAVTFSGSFKSLQNRYLLMQTLIGLEAKKTIELAWPARQESEKVFRKVLYLYEFAAYYGKTQQQRLPNEIKVRYHNREPYGNCTRLRADLWQ